MERQYECIDEQTNISSLSIGLCCKKMTANYKRTAQLLDALLEGSKGRVSPTLGGKILINTGDDKRLAVEIVDAVKDYFGEPKNKPKNTNREVLIIKRADDWLEGIKRSTAKTTHQEYIDLVVEKTRQNYTVDDKSRASGEYNKSFDEIIKAVEQWAEAKRKQPTLVQPLIDEQSRPLQPDIMTNSAKKYFAKAIEAGFMEQRGNGYKWTFKNGLKAALCYFIMKVYSPDITDPKTIRYKALEKLFDVERLDSALCAMLNAKKPQEWRGEIDGLFDD